ncbi:MAG: flavodoxin family protein [Candidatus Bathyarchaeota archaeon]|nr:flavodoxin family protein [Candidatus Bathyarchaeota archaeon]
MKENLAINADLNTRIVLFSYHHKNTQKVAEVIANVLDAQVKSPKETALTELKKYDLVGFGAGIDSGKHYRELLDFADSIPQVTDKTAFIFSTSGITGEKKRIKDHSALREKLQSKGYLNVDEFQCKGFNTNSFLKYFGGINKGRPNEEDLKHAEEFAQNLKRKWR